MAPLTLFVVIAAALTKLGLPGRQRPRAYTPTTARDERGIFELIENLTTGGSAQAYRHVWDEAEQVYVRRSTLGEYTIWDDIGAFDVAEGALIKAERMPDSGDWSIYQAPCPSSSSTFPGSGGTPPGHSTGAAS